MIVKTPYDSGLTLILFYREIAMLSPVQVNDYVNLKIRSKQEPPDKDEWQTPAQTISRRTGDCEDYSILKYFILRELEYKASILTVNLRSYGPHVLTALYHNGDVWLLDNIATEIVKFSDRYCPTGDIDRVRFESTVGGTKNDPRFNNMLQRLEGLDYNRKEILAFIREAEL